MIRSGNHESLSGALYHFVPRFAQQVMDSVRATVDFMPHEDNRRTMVGFAIIGCWLDQFAPAAPCMPDLVDASSGEPMLLITDHYRVVNADALTNALSACDDVSGDAKQGWRREFVGDDELVRSSVVVNPGKEPGRVEVFYRTRKQADEEREWFDRIAGPAVVHLTQEVVDPTSPAALSARQSKPAAPSEALPPEVLAQAVEQIMRKHYASWCDEAIPALGHKTPRNAVTTPAGLERVKGLLRTYEDDESRSRCQVPDDYAQLERTSAGVFPAIV